MEAKQECNEEAFAKQECKKEVFAKLECKQAKQSAKDDKGCVLDFWHEILKYWEEYYVQDGQKIQNLFKLEVDAWEHFHNVEEYTLEHTQLHKEYCALFEDAMEECMQHFQMDNETLFQRIREALDNEDVHAHSSVSAMKLVHTIKKVDDFVLWAKEMQRGAAQQRAFDDVD